MTDAELAETMAWYKTLPPLGNGPRNADKDFWREMDAMQTTQQHTGPRGRPVLEGEEP
jgi:hypothetical protein